MPQVRISFWVVVLLSLALHAGLLTTWTGRAPPQSPDETVPLTLVQPSPPSEPSKKAKKVPKADRSQPVAAVRQVVPPMTSAGGTYDVASNTRPEQTPASMAAPPPPTAEEWALASTYTLKNSKRYRYNWGQQVRSMMGTVVEGPQQGHVRFRIEIAPDGKIAKVDTLWSTSDVAAKLARRAIESMPPLPPTPTGQPLIFEQTIAFVPYESGWPPIYKYDCLPDPPKFQNPFVWDGKSPKMGARAVAHHEPATGKPAASNGCPNNAQPDSVEAEAADIKRQFDFWGSRPLNGVN